MGNHTINGTSPLVAPPSLRGLDVFLDGAVRVLVFVLLVLAFWAAGRMIRTVGNTMRRTPPTSSSLMLARLLTAALVLAGVWVGLDQIYHLNPVGVVATLGIASLALGFGLQNTVANIAAGVSLAVDKPFDVGDRIQVGETWGDVVGMGLRSTRIRTTSGEHVVVPNSVLDTQEVWNYTHHAHRELRLCVPFGISYGSSVALAEHLALEAARGSRGVLAYPEPTVRVRAFGADSVQMELRCWLGHAQDKADVQDAILRGIKRRFDEGGVHFPFPQRTVSKFADLPAASPTPEFILEEHSEKPIVLVVTRGAGPGRAAIDRVTEFIQRVDGRMVVAHVRSPAMVMHARQAQETVNAFLEGARRHGVVSRGRSEVGELPEVVGKVAKEAGARLVAVSAPHQRFAGWQRRELRVLRDATGAPVVFLDADKELDERFVSRWRTRLQPVVEPASVDAQVHVPAAASGGGPDPSPAPSEQPPLG